MASGDGATTSGAQRRLDAFNESHAQRRLPYYEALGVPVTATQTEITRAYRKLSLRLHPDKPGGCTERFQDLTKAYACLRDEKSRRKYDSCGFDEDNINTEEVDQFVDAFFGEGARSVDGRSPDWSMNAISNYVRINLHEVPLHMKDIVRIGLNYLVALDHDFEDVILLQHSRVDILYLMVGNFKEGELTQEVFESEDSYPITYYDNPLQPGIAPKWSDQNVLGRKKAKKKDLPRRELNFEEFQRRQKHALSMLENAPADPMAELADKYHAKMLAQQHEAARIIDAKRCAAIHGQDVYEDDAELDCNAFAQSRGETAANTVQNATANQTSDAVSSSPDCLALDRPSSNACARTYQSQGSEPVLGSCSDGIIFVASGGEVLRNEGPPRSH